MRRKPVQLDVPEDRWPEDLDAAHVAGVDLRNCRHGAFAVLARFAARAHVEVCP
jgi:hypothetical protein